MLWWVCCSTVPHQFHSLRGNTRLFSVSLDDGVNSASLKRPCQAVIRVFYNYKSTDRAVLTGKSKHVLIDLFFIPPFSSLFTSGTHAILTLHTDEPF